METKVLSKVSSYGQQTLSQQPKSLAYYNQRIEELQVPDPELNHKILWFKYFRI